MDNLYWYDTIEECEKEILDKSMILDLVHLSNINLFECFVRTVRTVMIWAMIATCLFIFKDKGFKASISILGLFLLVYIIGHFLMSWVKYNHNNAFNNMKVRLVDSMTSKCREYTETDYEEWQKKQMLKRFASLASIEIDWDNAK